MASAFRIHVYPCKVCFLFGQIPFFKLYVVARATSESWFFPSAGWVLDGRSSLEAGHWLAPDKVFSATPRVKHRQTCVSSKGHGLRVESEVVDDFPGMLEYFKRSWRKHGGNAISMLKLV